MNTIKNRMITVVLLLTIVLGGCSEDNVDKEVSVINIDTQSTQNELDKYIEAKFTAPYNIEVLYKWKDIESDMRYTLVPADYANSIKMVNLVKYLCLDAYEKVAPKDFLKKYFPKQLMLVGSSAFNNNGTRVLGTSEGGLKITLYAINTLETDDVELLNKRYFHTIYHEFSHILHQNVDYTTDFDRISAKDYKNDAWSSAWSKGNTSLEKGFISNYASKEPNEDFVEMIAYYVTNSAESWEEKLAPAGEEGREILEKKLTIIKLYLKTVWKIDIDELRAEIQSRFENLDKQDLDNITI